VLNPNMELSQGSCASPQGCCTLPYTANILCAETPHPRIQPTVGGKWSRKRCIRTEHVHICSCQYCLHSIYLVIHSVSYPEMT
jgi:hypothetical protein